MHLVMKMRTCGGAAVANVTNQVTTVYLLPVAHYYFTHVAIKRFIAVAMPDEYFIAITVI